MEFEFQKKCQFTEYSGKGALIVVVPWWWLRISHSEFGNRHAGLALNLVKCIIEVSA